MFDSVPTVDDEMTAAREAHERLMARNDFKASVISSSNISGEEPKKNRLSK
jgi:hypothetical protein